MNLDTICLKCLDKEPTQATPVRRNWQTTWPAFAVANRLRPVLRVSSNG